MGFFVTVFIYTKKIKEVLSEGKAANQKGILSHLSDKKNVYPRKKKKEKEKKECSYRPQKIYYTQLKLGPKRSIKDRPGLDRNQKSWEEKPPGSTSRRSREKEEKIPTIEKNAVTEKKKNYPGTQKKNASASPRKEVTTTIEARALLSASFH